MGEEEREQGDAPPSADDPGVPRTRSREPTADAHATAPTLDVEGVERASTGGPPAIEANEAPSSSARYRVLSEIGRGGMGRVLVAEDDWLGRRVALKARIDDTASERSKLRFREEARATAQLEHPNIVPVYNLDADEDGRPRFSMRLVEGTSLGEVIESLGRGEREARDRWGPAELLLVFTKICDAVAYAHSRGVLHRDLKPDNVMLGRFGEVFVMDWGLARVGETGIEDEQSGERRVSSVRDSGAELTMAGSIVGTPGYMAPEQARGALSELDARSDVWALGAILYELLTLERAIQGEHLGAILLATAAADVVPPRVRSPRRGVSEGLEAVVMRALAAKPAERYQSVGELREAVAQELEGSREAARRRLAAEEKLAAAKGHLARHRELREEHAALAAAVLAKLGDVPTDTEHLDERRALFREQARSDGVAAEATRAFWEAYGTLVAAVQDDPALVGPREALVKLLVGRAAEAREHGDAETARDLESIARQHDPPRVAGLLDAPATVELVTWPAGARARIAKFEPEGPLLVERPFAEIERTPATLTLPPGSYVADIAHPERPPIRATIVVGPGERMERRVWIPAEGVVASGYCYVPGGRYAVGGDMLAPGAEPRRIVELEPFAIKKYVVTMAEYAELLNHLLATDGEAAAAAHAPRVAATPYWTPVDGEYRLPFTDPDGDVFESKWPVCMLSAVDADTFAAFAARSAELAIRLPSSEEWEIAATGGDGRVYPWGNGFDAGLSWTIENHSVVVRARCVGTRPADTSPFSVCDMAGLVREWTGPLAGEPFRVARGGAWQANAEQCRVGRRTVQSGREGFVTTGVRLAHTLVREPGAR